MFKIKKRILAILLALVVTFTFAACSKKDDSKTSETSSTSTAEKKVADTADKKEFNVGIAIYNYSDNFMTLFRQELEKYFGELGEKEGVKFNLDIQDGKNDQNTQVEQLNNFVTQNKDLIIANLVDPTGAGPLVQNAKNANIPLIFINREPEAKFLQDYPDKSTYIGVDARLSGVLQGEIIASLANKGDVDGDGKVSYIMIQGDAGNVDAEQRTKYSVEKLQKSIPVEQLGQPQRGNWDSAKGQEITANALNEYGKKLEVVFSNNDSMALGAVQAIKSAGREINKDIYVVGVDALEDVLNLIKAGEFTGTVLNDYFNQSHTAAEIALKLLKGEKVAPYFWHDYVKVTKPEDAQSSRKEPKAETFDEYKARVEKTEKGEF